MLPSIRKDGGYIKGEEKVAVGKMTEEELAIYTFDVMRRKMDRQTRAGGRSILFAVAPSGRIVSMSNDAAPHPA